MKASWAIKKHIQQTDEHGFPRKCASCAGCGKFVPAPGGGFFMRCGKANATAVTVEQAEACDGKNPLPKPARISPRRDRRPQKLRLQAAHA